MAWIKMVAPGEAEGLLREIYDAAVERAGKVFNVIRIERMGVTWTWKVEEALEGADVVNILRIQSLRPKVLRSSTQLYLEVMHSEESGLSRAQREMIATVVSQLNHCHY